MNPTTEKRRARIINTVYVVMLIAIFYFVFTVCAPLVMPFFFALIVAAVFNKPVSAITKKTPLKRSILSVLFIFLFIGVIFAVFFLIGMELFKKIKEFIDYIMAQIQDTEAFFNEIKGYVLDFTSFLPDGIRSVLHENLSLFFDKLAQEGFGGISVDTSAVDWGSLLTKGGEVLTGTVAKIPSLIISFIVFLISSVFILSDYDRIKTFLLNQFSEKNSQRIKDGVRLGSSCLKKMFKAYGLIILITTFELTVGFYILKFLGIFDSQFIILIALGIALIDIIPVLGTGTVLIPWAVISFVSGNIYMGIGLLVLYVIILVIRQIIEPKLVAGQVGLPPIVTIMAMFIGSKTLGILGFFILPFCVILIKVFNDEGIIHLFKTSKTENTEDNNEALKENTETQEAVLVKNDTES